MSSFEPKCRQPVGHDLMHAGSSPSRSEEHTSELQSQSNLVCRLLLEKKKKRKRLVRIAAADAEALQPPRRAAVRYHAAVGQWHRSSLLYRLSVVGDEELSLPRSHAAE